MKQFKKNNLVEALSITCIILSIPYFFIFRYFQLFFIGDLILGFCVAFLIPLYLSRNSYPKLANLVLVIVATGLLTFYALILGKESGAQLVLFSTVTIPIALYKKSQFWQVFLITLIPISAAYFLEIVNYHFLLTPIQLSPEVKKFFHFCAMFTTFSFSILSSYLFYKSRKNYEKEILKSNSRLTTNIAWTTQIAQKLQRVLESEMSKAHSLQKSILPTTPQKYEGLVIDYVYIPSRYISGDYFDFFPISKTQIGMTMVDVVGKGIASSIEVFSLRTIIHILKEHWKTPKELIETLNRIASTSDVIKKYVPMIYLVINSEKRTVTYINAGHEPGAILRYQNNHYTIEHLHTTNAPIQTGHSNEVYKEITVVLGEKDRFILFTNGCLNVKNASEIRLSQEGFDTILLSLSNHPLRDLAKAIRSHLDRYRGAKPLEDDITIVTFGFG